MSPKMNLIINNYLIRCINKYDIYEYEYKFLFFFINENLYKLKFIYLHNFKCLYNI